MALREKKGFFGRLSEKIGDVLLGRASIDEDLFDELEEVLITSDIGMETTMTIIENLRERVKKERITDPAGVKNKLKEIMVEVIDKGDAQKLKEEYPLVIMMIGINGGGKTTSIGKIANMYKKEGKSVLLAAADTFRAAAAAQLEIWGERVGVNVIKHQEGADPSAVLFDAAQSAKAKGVDVLICDTAGRLQNKKNLMNELEKMNKILDREFPEAARETLLVLDATTGKNAVSQAKEFGEVADLTGVIITKLDGTAKGGIAITISDEYNLPVKFVGVGEGIDDLRPFDAEEFIGGIFDE
ncbi:MAG: signal recognition particle-docking protein FtsY [Eubacterium sp.]|nr:signal recognition particle-docking protein FtsY [Eubacterium sp.]